MIVYFPVRGTVNPAEIDTAQVVGFREADNNSTIIFCAGKPPVTVDVPINSVGSTIEQASQKLYLRL